MSCVVYIHLVKILSWWESILVDAWTNLSYHAASVHLPVMGTWWDEKWRIVNGINCRKCAECFPEEMIPYQKRKKL